MTALPTPPPPPEDHEIAAWWPTATPVEPMAWGELTRWSTRLRKLAHDVNNALVPAFAHTDLLRLRLGQDADLSQLDSLPAQLEIARKTVQRATAWALPRSQPQEPRWSMVQAELLMLCRQAHTAFVAPNIDVTRGSVNAAAPWPTATARHVLLALVRNATEALGGRPDGEVRLAVAEADGWLWLSITDNGPGCTDVGALARGEVVRHGDGHLGLGLPAAAAVAAQTGGELRISSGEGGGFRAGVCLRTTTL